MDQRRDRRRPLHGVGQPGMQEELRRLAHGADEQQQADQGQGIDGKAEEFDRGSDVIGGRGENGVEIDRIENQKHRHDTEHEAEVADPVHQEGLDRRRAGRRPLVPEADQQIGAQPDAFPAEEHLQEIVGAHQHQHGEGEQAEIGEEARYMRIVGHVADGIDMDQERRGGHHEHHHRGQHVEAQAPGYLERARIDPGHQLDGAARPLGGDLIEGRPAGQHGQAEKRAGDHRRCPVAQAAAEKPGNHGAEQGQEYGGDVNQPASLSSDSRPRPRWSPGCGKKRPGWRGRWPPRRRQPSARTWRISAR